MIFKLRHPQCFSEIGKRDNQEDYLWPEAGAATAEQRVFVLCDGVGGQNKGEVASKTAARAIGQYLTQHWPANGVVTNADFQRALAYAYSELDKADTGEDGKRKMGTTMTCVVFHTDGVLVAHIGDSRVYQLRPSLIAEGEEKSGIIHQTWDHSLVNELLKIGEITEEEAANHPRKNVITRAMQPNDDRRCKADITLLTDIKAGDYFFLCSDGVLEQVSNDSLTAIVADDSLDDAAKLAAIKAVCNGVTRDNHTCWLIGVDNVTEGQETTVPLIATAEYEAETSIPEVIDADDTNNDPQPVNAPAADDKETNDSPIDNEEPASEDIDEVTEEPADDDIDEVAEEPTDDEDATEADDAEEDDTTENVSAFAEDNNDAPEWDEDYENMGAIKRFVLRTRRKTSRACTKARTATTARFLNSKERIEATNFYQRIMATNRWHWIVGAIIFFSVYDLTLLLFGDKSYDIIFPKAEPLDGALIEEKPRLLQPEIEEYEAKKPDLEKAEREAATQPKLELSANEREETMEEPVPTTIETAPEAKPEIPKSSEIKVEVPKIEPKPENTTPAE